MTPDQRLAKTQDAVTASGSALRRYQDVIVGERSWLRLAYYEFCMWLSWIPGGLGIILRQLFWRRLFGACGVKVYFGANVTVMHPHRIRIGARTVISQGCVLDARSPATDAAITLGDEVVLSHGVVISCKNGRVSIGDRVGIGMHTVIVSAMGNAVSIGDDAVAAAGCYVVAGGNYNLDRLDVPIARQGIRPTGGTRVGPGVWLGAKVTVLDGVTIGRDSVVGAGAVVTKSLPDRIIAVGVPARVVRSRTEDEAGDSVS
jgi:acetyltransferase-like isoleucine patch superfamily enzyme